MRSCVCLVVASLVATAPAAGQTVPRTSDHRARVIAALNRLIETGEPADTENGEGAWLQMAVDIACVARDREIEQLAQRAAAPLLARVSPPFSSTDDNPSVELRHPLVLRLPKPVSSRAEIFASIDRGELVRLGEVLQPGSNVTVRLPAAAHAPGLHHLRLHARIVYSGTGGVPPPETRTLTELTYAVYGSPLESLVDMTSFRTRPW